MECYLATVERSLDRTDKEICEFWGFDIHRDIPSQPFIEPSWYVKAPLVKHDAQDLSAMVDNRIS